MERTYIQDKNFEKQDFSADQLPIAGTRCERTVLEKADLRIARNFSIDPELNKIRKAKFSIHGIAGLLAKYDIEIE